MTINAAFALVPTRLPLCAKTLPAIARRRASLFAIGSLCALLSGCIVPRFGEKAYPDLTYTVADTRPMRLDLLVPTHVKNPPLVVWIHGGGWRYGDKRFRFFLRDFTSRGFAVATVQYRLSIWSHWPAQRDDTLAALHWLQSHGRTYGYDETRIGLSGDSAGGHLAALLGVTEKTLRVRAVAVLYPVTDLRRIGQEFDWNPKNLVIKLFGQPYRKTISAARAGSPVNYVTPNDPPFLIFHGDQDVTVPLDQSEDLAARLHAVGVPCTLVVVKGRGHGFAPDAAMKRQMADFFAAYLRKP